METDGVIMSGDTLQSRTKDSSLAFTSIVCIHACMNRDILYVPISMQCPSVRILQQTMSGQPLKEGFLMNISLTSILCTYRFALWFFIIIEHMLFWFRNKLSHNCIIYSSSLHDSLPHNLFGSVKFINIYTSTYAYLFPNISFSISPLNLDFVS